MPLVKISGVPPWDGEYSLDLASITGRELHQIKQASGVRANELGDALIAGDYDLLVALAIIAVERSGRQAPPLEALLEAPVGQITFEDDPDEVEEDEQRPPASTPTPNGNENSDGVGVGDSAQPTRSGATSNATGDSHPSDPSRIGSPGSAHISVQKASGA